MKYPIWIVVFMLLTATCAHSKTVASTDVKVDSGLFSIPSETLSIYLSRLNAVLSSLDSCTNIEVTAHHPLNDRESVFSVSPIGGVCQFNLIRDMRWKYDCTLYREEKSKLQAALGDWVKTQQGLGDFPVALQKILFDKKICSAKRF